MATAAEALFPVPLPPGMPAPNVAAALDTAGKVIRAAWQDLAADHNDTGAYLAALTAQGAIAYPYLGDADAVAVINPLPQADWLEEGRAGFHLPAHWGRGGGKWKTSAEGDRYATVPFRVRSPAVGGRTLVSGGPGLPRRYHESSTPSRRRMMMPPEVYARARQLEHGQRLTGFGDQYKQSKSYRYYRQAFAGFPADLPEEGYTWKTSPYEGLVRSTMPTPGGGRHTEYVAFRTITPDSPGWYIPPTPAYHFAARALERVRPEIARQLDAAAAADLAAAIVDATKGLLE